MTAIQRPSADRDKRKAILIATEDARSARFYFEDFREHLRSHRIVVLADHEGSAPKSVVEAAKKAKNIRETEYDAGLEDRFDEVWVVFDTEGPQNTQRQTDARHAIEQCRQLGFKTAVSNPAFEFWLLLHYCRHVKPIANGKAACRLLEARIPGYTKNGRYFAATFDRIWTAIENSLTIFSQRCVHLGRHPCDCHPCTELHELARSLLGES